jgi:type III pantothenate kinase
MLLTIDVGNTNLTLGLYEGDQLVRHWRLATDHTRNSSACSRMRDVPSKT